MGTISNPEGDFSIQTDQLPVWLQIRYIGYQTAQVQITNETDFPVIIELERSLTELDEIVVTDRDPGLSIMERVIARKQIWRSNLQNYRVDAYTRQVLSSDTSIASISESNSVLYHDNKMGYREIQLNTRQTLNLNADQNYSGVRYLPNFYDEDIEIAGYNVVGITHPDALRFYHFSLIETTVIDNHPVFKIEVIPKRERQPLFEGIAWVHGGEYALIEVDLKPNRVVTFPPPVQDFNLIYRQQFSNYGRDFWLPVDMRIEGGIRVSMVGLRFPPINFRQVSRLSGYEVNTAIPDSVFNNLNVFSRADSSRADAVSAPESREQIPLTDEEQLAYEKIDSTKTLEDAFRPEGFLARMIDDDNEENGNQRDGPFAAVVNLMPNGLKLKGRFNRVDGFHAALGYGKRIESLNNRFDISAGYSFHSGEWDYSARLNQTLYNQASKQISFLIGYGLGTDTRYTSQMYPVVINSIASVLGAEDYYDYFRNRRFSTGLQFRNIVPSSAIAISADMEKHDTVSGELYNYSLFGWHEERRPNLPIEEGNLNSIKFEWNINREDHSFGFAGNNGVEISTEWSDSALGSDFNFLKLAIAGEVSIPTFYQRRLFANQLDIHFSGGTAAGRLPIQRYGAIDGSVTRFTPFGSLRTRNYLPYEGERYWLLTAEHNFRTIPFELLGLRTLVNKGWGIILFGGAGAAYAGESAPDGVLDSDGIHSEAGVSLNSVFGVMRVDFAKRLDRHGFFIGFSIPRYF